MYSKYIKAENIEDNFLMFTILKKKNKYYYRTSNFMVTRNNKPIDLTTFYKHNISVKHNIRVPI